MEFQIEFKDRSDPADVEITLSGELELAGFFRFSESLRSDPRFRAGLLLLVDLSNLDAAPVAEVGVETLSAPIVERDWNYPPRAVAIIAPDPATLDAVRAYRAHLGGSKSKREIFTSRTAAVAWLEDESKSKR